jgi:hypothetical protein
MFRLISDFFRLLFLSIWNLFAVVGLLVVIVLALALTEMPEWPKPDPVGSLFGCSEPCIIAGNNGGSVWRFVEAAQAVKKGAREKVVIDGYCASACAIFADLVRPKVCVTRKASFGFHKARFTIDDLTVYADPPHSEDVLGWVRKNGGFPAEKMLDMKFPETRRFWPLCPEASKARK